MNNFNPLNYKICFESPKRIAPSAWFEHIPFAMLLVSLLKPKTFVELGTHYGVSYCAFCQAAKKLDIKAKFYAVDSWEGDPHAGLYGEDVLEDLKKHHDPLYGHFSKLIQGKFEGVVKNFEDNSIDLLHIDGYHSYEAVSGDFNTWFPKISEKGIVLFHDIMVKDKGFGVWQFWNEVKKDYDHFEFHHGHGLGVLAVGKKYPKSLKMFVENSTNNKELIRTFFEAQGRYWSQYYQLDKVEEELKTTRKNIEVYTKRNQNLVKDLNAIKNQYEKRYFNQKNHYEEKYFNQKNHYEEKYFNLKNQYENQLEEQKNWDGSNFEREFNSLKVQYDKRYENLRIEYEQGNKILKRLIKRIIPPDSKLNIIRHRLLYLYANRKKIIPKVFNLLKKMRTEAGGANIPSEFYCSIDGIENKFIVGKGNVIYLRGNCYDSKHLIKSISVLIDENGEQIEHFVKRHSLPNLDFLDKKINENKLPVPNSLISEFFAYIPVNPVNETKAYEISIKVVLGNNEVRYKKFSSLSIFPKAPSDTMREVSLPTPPYSDDNPIVAICLPTYNPNIEWFREQIESIFSQDYENWLLIINDDHSNQAVYDEIKKIVSDNGRVRVYRNDSNLGFYYNVEKCLSLVPENAEFIALCDQDDIWHENKLSASLDKFDKDTSLVYSDCRIINSTKDVIDDTFWRKRKNNFKNLGALLFTNTVTGAASIFRANLLPYLLPFPQYLTEAYHDHWLGVVALTLGKINYIDLPLYDYRQHSSNVIGHSNPETGQFLKRFRDLFTWMFSNKSQKNNLTGNIWNIYHSYSHYLDIVVFWSMILFIRFGENSRYTKLFKRYSKFDQSSFLLLLEGIKVQPLANATLNIPLMCFYALVLRRKLKKYCIRNREEIVMQRFRSLGQDVGEVVDKPKKIISKPIHYPEAWKFSLGTLNYIPNKIESLNLVVTKKTETTVNIIFSEIKFKYFFGGYFAVFKLAQKIRDLGYSVRIILVDECDFNLDVWRKEIKQYSGLENFFDEIEVIYRYDRSLPVIVSPSDSFIATSWWTAHIADKATRRLGNGKFIYLTQEFEPIFYSGGSYYALSMESYEFPHFALYSTELLKDYAKQNRIGVFKNQIKEGEKNSTFFENAIGSFPPSIQNLSSRHQKRLLFYARLEEHARRNAFELGMLALRDVVMEGHFDKNKWEFHGIGSVNSAPYLPLSENVELKLLPKLGLNDYYNFITEYDIGLSLMISPHPSLMPLDLAAAGVVTVTNTFENKTKEALASISGNLVPVLPTIEDIKRGLREAVTLSDNVAGRLKGTDINWARDWDQSYNSDVMTKLDIWIKQISKSL